MGSRPMNQAATINITLIIARSRCPRRHKPRLIRFFRAEGIADSAVIADDNPNPKVMKGKSLK